MLAPAGGSTLAGFEGRRARRHRKRMNPAEKEEVGPASSASSGKEGLLCLQKTGKAGYLIW